jgi:dihydroorotase
VTDGVVDLDLSRVWLVDPDRGREGPAEVVVRRGIIRSIRRLRGPEGRGIDDRGVVVAPAFVDLHAHFREPGNQAAETIASGMRAAAHGGFGTVCLMPNTNPAIDTAAAVRDVAWRAAEAVRGSGDAAGPVALRVWGAVTVGRLGEQLAPLGELAEAGVAGFSDDGAPIRSANILRSALAYAGMLGLPIVDHAEDPTLTAGAEGAEGLVATVLGLKAWPIAAEASIVARDIAILEDVLRDVPGARLHLTHLSAAASLDIVRAAKARALPVTCDVTPHHLALSDEWLAGARRWAWGALDDQGRRRDPWGGEGRALVAGPYDSATKVNPPLRSPDDAVACLRALGDGTADALATDHAPHADVDKAVEFGLAPNGISGIETALGVLLAAVDAGHLSLGRAMEALTAGPRRVLASAAAPAGAPRALTEGAPADLVVFDRSQRWTVGRETLESRGKNSPLLGMELAGAVLLTVHDGRIAYRAEALPST